jgi:endonuclease III
VQKILPILKKAYPAARCSLGFSDPLELLIATILSAQCTDERVNMVTPAVFRKYPTAQKLAAAPVGKLEKDIQSTGFFRNKAKSLRGMAQSIVEKHGGKVPQTMEELVELPGVGRKTANVVLGNAFDKNVGVVVDTHVARISGRLGLSGHADPGKIEQDLMQVVPQEDWAQWAHLLIFHGRKICQARKPKCEECPLLEHCPYGRRAVADQKR